MLYQEFRNPIWELILFKLIYFFCFLKWETVDLNSKNLEMMDSSTHYLVWNDHKWQIVL